MKCYHHYYHRLLGGVRPGQRVLVDHLELPLEVGAELALNLVVEDHVAEEDGHALQLTLCLNSFSEEKALVRAL